MEQTSTTTLVLSWIRTYVLWRHVTLEERFRSRLRQFDDVENISVTLLVPGKCISRAKRHLENAPSGVQHRRMWVNEI